MYGGSAAAYHYTMIAEIDVGWWVVPAACAALTYVICVFIKEV